MLDSREVEVVVFWLQMLCYSSLTLFALIFVSDMEVGSGWFNKLLFVGKIRYGWRLLISLSLFMFSFWPMGYAVGRWLHFIHR